MLRVAVFIDAGYVWKQLAKALAPDDERYGRSKVHIDYQRFHGLLTEYVKDSFPRIPLLRCYWYDGPLPDGSRSADHAKVASLNDFKLRLGSRAIETSEGKKKQKGVDGLIIADLIALAQNKAISHALLLSGDGDMVPGVGVAQALGVRVHLLAIHAEEATSPHLKMEADFSDIWRLERIKEFAKARIPSEAVAQKTLVSDLAPMAHPCFPAMPESIQEVDPPLAAQPSEIPPCTLSGHTVPLSDFFNSLPEDEKKSITQDFVPYAIDRRLLRLGYESKKNTPLTEEEKRSLRDSLKAFAAEYSARPCP